MAETKQGKQLLTVARVFFLLIVIPLLLMSFLIANGIFQLGDVSKKGAISVLDEKSQQEMLIRATTVAENVANFLQESERNVLIATILPQTPEAYKEFVENNKQALWMKQDGQIVKILEPLYTEMALIDEAGNEVIKIAGGEISPKSELVNVSDPANTTFKTEEYFQKTKALNKGDVYISPVTGLYVNRSEFESGKRFEGIVRFATPLFDKQGFTGMITLALDVRHLAAMTDTIIPTQTGHVLEADASTGNYAYMVDNRGYVISHPNDYHIAGLREDGTPVPPFTGDTAAELSKKGEEVLNLNLLGDIDAALPQVAQDAAAGNSGVKVYKFAGHTKVVAYAPVPYYSVQYPTPAGFGWVALGVDVDKYNEQARIASDKIEKEANAWMATIVLILVIAMILLFIIASLLARGVNRSIEAEVPPESLEAGKYYDDED
ncbi:MAG: cache domain-containing protein [Deltaproteobacteria bacterium]|nr:cache domain-containing protein [Deltaproteobacteria bacterium]